MKTDTLFYQLFQSFPSLFFELLELPPENGASYQFVSLEVKEKAFRFDGIFLPPENEPDWLIWFTEVQFQKNLKFYSSFFTEIFMYFEQYNCDRDWKAVAIFAKRSVDVEISRAYRSLVAGNHLVKIYLDEWDRNKAATWGIGLVQLIVAQNAELEEVVPNLLTQVRSKLDLTLQQEIVDWIEMVLVYKLPQLTREEIETMFTISDLKQTRVYQEALEEGLQLGKQEGLQLGKQEGLQLGKQEGLQLGKQEGLQLGKQEGLQRQVAMLLRLLTRKFGKVSLKAKAQISRLSEMQLEDLAEAILDFNTVADLNAWLRDSQNTSRHRRL
jgi:predicted transposase/invertase (TIGR01784 family)